MIEHNPNGIACGAVGPKMLEACGSFPIIVYDDRVKQYHQSGFLIDDATQLTPDPAKAQRFTLAYAWFLTHADPDNRTHLYLQPIDYLVLDLPMPLSTNALFVEAPNKKGPRTRIATRAYKAWREAAMYAIKPQLRSQGAPAAPVTPIFDRHWAMWIRLRLDHCSDITNRIKALEDLLVSWKVTVGDQWNDRCLVERDQALNAECRVIIYRKVQDNGCTV